MYLYQVQLKALQGNRGQRAAQNQYDELGNFINPNAFWVVGASFEDVAAWAKQAYPDRQIHAITFQYPVAVAPIREVAQAA